MSAATKLLTKFAGVKKTSSGWSARCPAHEDRQASLSIGVGDDGRVLLKCHAGCDYKKIVAALGLEERDLFDTDGTPPTTKKSSSSKPTSKAYKSAVEAQKAYERTWGKPATVHEYLDENGVHVGSVIRWQPSPTQKEIRPIGLHADGWRLQAMAEPRPLLDRRTILETAGTAFVVEGEKSFDAASGLGLLATTSSGGSESASMSDWSPLAGREVVILPDNDDPGRKYAADVAAILHELDPPATVRVVELDGLDKGGDVADLYEACRDEEEFKALGEKIERLAGETEPLKPKATPSRSSTSSSVEAYKPFPVDVLPEPLSSFVAESAAAIGCDPAYVALPLLTATGAAIGTTRRLTLKYGYNVPAIVWTVVVGESGTRKSAPLRSVLQCARLREMRLREEYASAQRQYQGELALYEKEYAAWRGDKKGSTEPPERPPEPVSRRLIVNDTTVEALACKLCDNPRGLLLARDELNAFFGGLDRYAKHGGGDEEFYLSCYNAESHAVDRRTGDRREIYVPQCGTWLTGTIQPGVLRGAVGPKRRQSGLLARLLLTSPPAQPPKWSEDEVSPLTSQRLYDVLGKLYELEPDVNQDGWYEAHLVKLSPAAKAAYVAWHDQHGVELAAMAGDRRAAWSKLLETSARLALIVHEVRVATGKASVAEELDVESMEAGIVLCEWLKHETNRVYAILDETDDERAVRQADDRLAAFVAKHGGSVAARDVIAGVRSIPDANAAERALQRLVDAGRGLWIDKPTSGEGGRPGRLFVLIGQATSAQPPKLPALQGCADADAGSRAERQAVANEDYVEL
jgi:hypothetical protein